MLRMMKTLWKSSLKIARHMNDPCKFHCYCNYIFSKEALLLYCPLYHTSTFRRTYMCKTVYCLLLSIPTETSWHIE
jgi:hypothetical protein